MSEIDDALRKYRKRLESYQGTAAKELLDEWYRIERRYREELQLLVIYMQDLKMQGLEIDIFTIHGIDRYNHLLEQLQQEIRTNKVFARVLEDGREYGIGQSLKWSDLLLNEVGMGVKFSYLPVEPITNYMAVLQADAPLGKLIDGAYHEAADGVRRGLIDGLAMGESPRTVAKNIASEMGLGLDRLTLIARTEQNRAWRKTAERRYKQFGVVEKVKRMSARAVNTCLACLLDDGKIYDINEDIGDHPNGLCTTVPILITGDTVEWETGLDWLERQDDEIKEKILGTARFEAYQAGADLNDFYTIKTNSTWGNSPAVVPLRDLPEYSII